MLIVKRYRQGVLIAVEKCREHDGRLRSRREEINGRKKERARARERRSLSPRVSPLARVFSCAHLFPSARYAG